MALSDLASGIGANYTRFTLVHWLLVLAMLGLIVSVWHQILIDSISLDWIPDLGDATLPFGIGILELLLNHLITLSLSLWLIVLAVALFSLEVVGSTLFVRQRAEKAADENPQMLVSRDASAHTCCMVSVARCCSYSWGCSAALQT